MLPGEIIADKFRIERVLGQGGMGVVVVATHLKLDQTVALKFLHDNIASETDVIERFVREARASAKLKSEHACRIMDVAQLENGTPYIVMELLEGQDLSAVIRKAPLSPPVAADYVLQACVAIAEAHAAGIVHRDLKPSNLFVTERLDGTPLVKVLDFGIAKAPAKSEVELTRTAAVMGSPGYMSPEQLRSAKDVDTRTDIWSLGVILYEAVSGRLPFRAETLTELAMKVGMDAFEPLQVDRAYSAVVTRCLEKPMVARYQSVSELAVDLSRIAGARGATSAAMISRLGNPRPSAPIPTPAPIAPVGIAATLPATAVTGAPLVVEATGPERRDKTPVMPVTTTLSNAVMSGAPRVTVNRSRRKPLVLLGLGVISVGAVVTGLAMRGGSKAEQPRAPDAAVPTDEAHKLVGLRVSRRVTEAGEATLIIEPGGRHFTPSLIRPARDLPLELVVGFQGTEQFMLDTARRRGAFDDIQKALRTLTGAFADPRTSRGYAFTLGTDAALVGGGNLLTLGQGYLDRERFRGKTVFTAEASLSGMMNQIEKTKFDGRIVMLVISGPISLSQSARRGLESRLARPNRAGAVEVHHIVLDDGVPDSANPPAMVPTKLTQRIKQPSELADAISRVLDRIAGETGLDFQIPESVWQRAKNVSLELDGRSITIDPRGRDVIVLE